MTQNRPMRKANVVTVSSVCRRKRMPTMTDSSPRTAISHRVPPVSSLSAMAVTMRKSPATNSQMPSRMAKA